MKIAIISNAKSIHTIRWATALVKRGLDVTIISTSPNNIPSVPVIELSFLNTNYLPIINKFVPIINGLKLRKILNSIKPDIIHVHNLKPLWFYALALLGKRNLIVSTWGSDILIDAKKSSINKFITRLILFIASQVTATSHYLAAETNRYTSKKISIIPFGVDTDIFKPSQSTDHPFTIGYFKGWGKIYGLEYLLEAMIKLQEKYPDTVLRLAGYGNKDDEDGIRHLIKAMDVKNVDWVGSINNRNKLASAISSCDIIVMPSLSESFGVSALEASASGIPVIASGVGGVPEVVKDGVTGYLVPPADSKAIYDKLIILINDHELRKSIGNNGRVFVEKNYLWDKNVNSMNSIYNKIIK